MFVSGSGDIGSILEQSEQFKSLQGIIEKHDLEISPTRLVDSYLTSIRNTHTVAKQKGIEYPEVNILGIWKEVFASIRLPFQFDLQRFAIEFELTINPVYPMPGMKNCLEECRKRNLVLGIISNAQFYTPLLFNWFLGAPPEMLGFHSSLVIYSYQRGIAKPSLELFETASNRVAELGLENHQVLYVGNDMLKDILPAKKVGFKTALFAGDKRSLRLREDNPECRSLQPDLILTHLTQLYQ